MTPCLRWCMAEFLIETIVALLSVFKSDRAIGSIVAVMIACALFAIVRVATANLHQNFCINSVWHILTRSGDQDTLAHASSTARAYDYPEFNARWAEFHASVKADPTSGRPSTPVHPSSLFSIEALGLTMRNYERVAALFVSVGLVLTFMGLVAALQQSGVAILSAGSADTDIKSALSDLLLIVSSKFILSITGLACSITINLAIDQRLNYNRRCVSRMNAALDAAVDFVPAEVLLRDMRDLLAQTQSPGAGAAP